MLERHSFNLQNNVIIQAADGNVHPIVLQNGDRKEPLAIFHASLKPSNSSNEFVSWHDLPFSPDGRRIVSGFSDETARV